jgi:hypothetical protein
MVTYAVYRSGSEILRGTTREQKDLYIKFNEGSFCVEMPDGLMAIGETFLNMAFWNSESQKALVWIKGIRIPENISKSYRLHYSHE